MRPNLSNRDYPEFFFLVARVFDVDCGLFSHFGIRDSVREAVTELQ